MRGENAILRGAEPLPPRSELVRRLNHVEADVLAALGRRRGRWTTIADLMEADLASLRGRTRAGAAAAAFRACATLCRVGLAEPDRERGVRELVRRPSAVRVADPG